MATKVVKALNAFHRSDIKQPVSRGDVFECDEKYADDLVRVGNAILTKVAPEPKKKTPTGIKPSASQVGQASQTRTSRQSRNGGKKEKSE